MYHPPPLAPDQLVPGLEPLATHAQLHAAAGLRQEAGLAPPARDRAEGVRNANTFKVEPVLTIMHMKSCCFYKTITPT